MVPSILKSQCLSPHRESDKESLSPRNGILPNISGMSRNDRHGFLFGQGIRVPRSPFTIGFGSSLPRYMSTEIEEGYDNAVLLGDAADTITYKTVQVLTSQAPAVSEVAVAAADPSILDPSILVAAFLHLIDSVHNFTGLNWWAAIAVTTILIEGATLPILVNWLKASHKIALLRPRLEEINQKVQAMGMSPFAEAEGKRERRALYARYGVNPVTPFKGYLIQVPITVTFFLAISNMAEKVPSLRTGGALWFTDHTTRDSLYILPLLAARSIFISAECNEKPGLEGNPIAGTMKDSAMLAAILAVAVPVTMGFPKAHFCYWITSNLFFIAYGLVIKCPAIRKLLDLPGVPPSPASISPSDRVKEPTKAPDLSQVASNRTASSHKIKHAKKKNNRT